MVNSLSLLRYMLDYIVAMTVSLQRGVYATMTPGKLKALGWPVLVFHLWFFAQPFRGG